MDFIRIGDKIISRSKINKLITKIFELRSRGWSQQDIADEINTDRTFISRLETLGEVRRGRRIAIVGFPVANKEEIRRTAEQEGVELVFLLSEEERWSFVEDRSGLELFNAIMTLLAQIREFDVVIILASNKRVKLVESLLDKEVISIEIGSSPIGEDKYVDPEKVADIIRHVRR
ncbi:MAG: transcriptional regulator [bacterium]|jgi:transcriptional regulator